LFFSVNGPVAQVVEHLTFNQVVAGSNPARLTLAVAMSRLKTIRFFIESLFLRLGLLVIPRLSRGVIKAAAAAAGRVGYVCCPGQRRIAMANLRIAFGDSKSEKEIQAIAAKSFQVAALVIMDFMWFRKDASARMSRHVEADPAVQRLLSMPPHIAVTAHFGNWEIISAACAKMGISHAAVFAGLKNPFVTPFLAKLRNAEGVETLRKEGAAGKLLKTLRRGGTVALLLDQNTLPENGGVFVKFFGLPVPVSGIAGLLSERTGVPVLMLFCRLKPDGNYFLYAPMEIRPSEDGGDDGKSKTADEITLSIMRSFESEISKHPEQWLWMYKRWKFIAPGTDAGKYPFYSRRP
jgi:Kdo2-lipid IVA lauroyltransferase/acyltransferase